MQEQGVPPQWVLLAFVPQGAEIEFAGAEAVGDARLMTVTTIGGQRVKALFRAAVDAVQEVNFVDFPVPGPRTALWCLKFINRRNGGAIDWHRFWEHTHGLKSEFWGVGEHLMIMQAVDLALTYDALDVVNLGAFELMIRKAQLIEYSYSEWGGGGMSSDGAGADGKEKKDKKGKGRGGLMRVGLYDEPQIFMGGHKEFGDIMVAPDLLDYVSKEVERDASVLKQVRKAREERAAAGR
jgi:hypothetical protein